MILPLIITIALAEYAARDDFHQIGNDDKIRHGIQWLFRASVVTLACWLSGTWWLAFGMAGLFSAYFRWRLNTLRELDWRYVSPSSWYDWQFIRLTMGRYSREQALEDWFILGLCQDALRAGTLAYIFEALLFVGVMVAYIWAR